VPQAVRIDTNLDALDLLHRDVVNVCTWFSRRGVEVDGEEIYAELSASIF
jgi:RIO kinase 1